LTGRCICVGLSMGGPWGGRCPRLGWRSPSLGVVGAFLGVPGMSAGHAGLIGKLPRRTPRERGEFAAKVRETACHTSLTPSPGHQGIRASGHQGFPPGSVGHQGFPH
jgi:hypothetical protein